MERIKVLLAERNGEFHAFSQSVPRFAVVRATKDDAIEAARQSVANHFRQIRRPPKGTIGIEREKIVVSELDTRVRKFGGQPIKRIAPTESVTFVVDA